MRLHTAVRLLIAAIAVAPTGAVAVSAELPAELLHPPCVACEQSAEATRKLFSKADWSRLEKGEVVVVDGSADAKRGDGAERRESEAAVLVPRPAAEVWAVLTDFESRPRVFPNVSESQVERVDANRAWIRQVVEVLWTKIRYTLIASFDPAHGLITFVLDRSAPHDIRDDSGSWQVFPCDDSSTLLLSRDRVDSGRPVPGMLERYLVKRSLPKMMKSLRREVERRAGNANAAR